MPQAILELVDVAKHYDPVAGQAAAAILEGLNLTVTAGQSVAIVGPSGCGKSTLLNLIGALDRPSAGKVLLEGKDLSGLSDRDLSRLRSRKIGFIFQLHHLLPQCTVMENVLVPVLADGRCRAADRDRAKSLLDRVGLGSRTNHRPGQLSGGECQRAAVVRAMINQPSLLLADEPTGALDHASSQSMGDLLAELNRDSKVTLITVTHSMELAARMGTVYELLDGKLVARGQA